MDSVASSDILMEAAELALGNSRKVWDALGSFKRRHQPALAQVIMGPGDVSQLNMAEVPDPTSQPARSWIMQCRFN